MENREPKIFQFGDFLLDLDKGTLRGAEGDVALRAKSFELLAYFVGNAGRVLPKDELLSSVWGKIAVTDDSLTQCVHDIRRAIEDTRQALIKTVPRRGYIFSKERLKIPKIGEHTSPAALPMPSERISPGIAVLPFANLSSDPEQAYFADGITEDIITDLSKVSGLHVAARNSSFVYRAQTVPIGIIAKDLGVDYVLEGSVRKVAGRVRVTGQLIEAASGGHIWADRFDRDLTDIFVIQDEITVAIVNELRVRLLPAEVSAIQRAPTTNVEAYGYYLKGRQFAHEWTKPYTVLARRMFMKAIELDPRYARAYAGVASADAALYGWHSAEVAPDLMLEMSAKALSLDPELADAHAARGLALHRHGRLDEAKEEFEVALALAPNLHEAHFYYGRLAFMLGDREHAYSLFAHAAELRSDDYISPVHIMSCCQALGRPVERQTWAQTCMARAKHALMLHPENAGPFHRGALALAHIGDRKLAKIWAAQALALDPDDKVTNYNIACVYSILGDVESALDILERLADHSSAEQIDWFRYDPDLDPIRKQPRFQRLFGAS